MSSAASLGNRRGGRRVSASQDECDWTVLIGYEFCVCNLIGWGFWFQTV